MKITIIIPPKAQMRARSRGFICHGKIMAQTYKAKEQEDEETRLITLLLEHRPSAPLPGPLMLGIWAYLPIPKSMSDKKRALALSGELRPETKPDLDNLIKHIKDCCKGIFWGDDKQVVGYMPEIGKYYGDPPRWVFELLTLDEYRAGLVGRYHRLMIKAQGCSENFAASQAAAGSPVATPFERFEAGRLF